MTKQEIFDIVWNGIISQGGPSLLNEIGCAYRGYDNRKCAIGWLIPDDEYKKEFEGCGLNSLSDNILKNYLKSKFFDLKFLKDLQLIHDQSSCEDKIFIEEWRVKMKEFAIKQDLIVKEN